MKRLFLYFAACSAPFLLDFCSETPPKQEPGLIRADPGNAVNTSEENYAPLDSGEGNFENMVADYESKDRVIWQKPDLVIGLLGDLEDKTVADIGAGTGYFAFRIVSKAEKVIAIDIDPRFISFMDSIMVRLPEEYRSRFESRLAKADDPMLAPREADAVMIVNTYGYIENRIDYLSKLRTGLREGGTLLIIDFKKNNLPVGPSDDYKVALGQVRQELIKAGFTITTVDRTTLDYQYIIQAKNMEPAPK